MKMRIIKPLIVGVALLLSSASFSTAAESRLFDQFGNLNCEDEMARLDHLAVASNNYPDYAIYIFIYGGRSDRRGEAKARLARVKNYLVRNRGLDINRLKLEDGGYREDLTVEIWLIPPGSPPPRPTPTLSPEKVRFRREKIKKSELSCA